MKCDQAGYNFIKRFEAFRAAPYLDEAGVWTIGYGHTRGVNRTMSNITEDAAESLFEEDLEPVEECVTKLTLVSLSQSQFNALASFTFNEGMEAFRESTLLRKVNMGDFRGAGKQFERWIYFEDPSTGIMKISNGLVKRRKEEKELFLCELDRVRSLAGQG